METFLIFLAIIAIQMIAAYFKQKKEAERKKQSKPERIPQEAAPIPDPFKEIREMMGLPSVEEPEELEEPRTLERLEEPVLERILPTRPDIPFKSITDRATKENTPLVHKDLPERKLKIHQAININEPGQGILWTAILQEPRYRIKWKPLNSQLSTLN